MAKVTSTPKSLKTRVCISWDIVITRFMSTMVKTAAMRIGKNAYNSQFLPMIKY